MANDDYEISEKKLHKTDHFRAQVQFDTTEDKLIYAVFYYYMKHRHPDSVKDMRDYFAPRIIERVTESFRIIWKTNAADRAAFPRWIEENVEPELRKKVHHLVYDDK